jgi:ABC-type nitrate/sulfonate/bicarbonate transport system permease component
MTAIDGHGTSSFKVAGARVAIILLALAGWELAARAYGPLLAAPPSLVAPALLGVLSLDTYPELPRHLFVTAREIGIAFALAVAGGLATGFVLGLYRTLGRAYGPILAALYAVPAVVWYPSLMLFFGLDSTSKIAFGFLLGFFPITLAVLAGISQVSPHLVTVARAFGAPPLTTFVKVMVPAMLFTLVGGLRTGLALSVIGVIVGEILGSKAGIGSLINHAYGLLKTADYVALVLVTLVLIVATDALASLVEHRAQRWTD